MTLSPQEELELLMLEKEKRQRTQQQPQKQSQDMSPEAMEFEKTNQVPPIVSSPQQQTSFTPETVDVKNDPSAIGFVAEKTEPIKRVLEAFSYGNLKTLDDIAGVPQEQREYLDFVKSPAEKASFLIGEYLSPAEIVLGGTTAPIFQQAADIGAKEAGRIGGRVIAKTRKPFEKAASPIIKSRAARKATEELSKTKKQITGAKKVFDAKSSKVLDDIGKGIKRYENKIKQKIGLDINNFDDAMLDINKNIKTYSNEMQKVLNKSQGVVKENFKKEYDKILKGNQGGTPILIDDTINEIINTSGIKTMRGEGIRDKFIKSLESLRGTVDNETYNRVKSIAGEIPVGALTSNIELRDAHWLKQALYDAYGSLRRNPSTQELAFSFKSIGDNLASNIDKAVGGEYSNLSKRYSQYLKSSDEMASKIGKMATFDDKEIREGTQKLFNQLKTAATKGDISAIDDVFVAQNDKIRALKNHSEMLRENGFTEAAGQIDNNLSKIYRSYYDASITEKNIKKMRSIFNASGMPKSDIDAILNSTKETKRMLGESNKRIIDIRKQRKELIENIKSNKIKYNEDVAKKVASLDNEIIKLQDDILKTDDANISLIGLNIMGRSLGNILPGGAILKRSIDLFTGIEGAAKYGALSADQANRALQSLENFVVNSTASPKAKKAYLAFTKAHGATVRKVGLPVTTKIGNIATNKEEK